MPDQFCEDCRAPISPGSRFCEDCGAPVPSSQETAVFSATASSTVPQDYQPERIIAVFPFASRPKGFIGAESISIVFTSRRIVQVPWNSSLESILKPARKRLNRQIDEIERKGGDRAVILAPLAFDSGPPFPPWHEIFSDLPEGSGIPLQEIEYIRGEQEDVAHFHEDLLVISTSAGEQQLTVDAGWYTVSVSRLLPLLWETFGNNSEDVLGIIPLCNEPEREGFGFAYSYTIIVTSQRIIYAFINDSFADIQNEYLKDQMKAQGVTLVELGETLSTQTPEDAPWLRYLRLPVSDIFKEDPLNFFIPLWAIRSVTIILGKKDEGDLLILGLSSHEEQLALNPGFGRNAASIFMRATSSPVNLR